MMFFGLSVTKEARKQVAHLGSTLTSAGPMMFEPMQYFTAARICSRCGTMNFGQAGEPGSCSKCGQPFPGWSGSLLRDDE
jgi:ribosomal protein L37E